MCIPKIGYLLCVDREILNMEFFFHKQCVIYILKILPASNSCCFKVDEVIELDQNESNIFHLFCFWIYLLLYYYPYTENQ